MRTRAGHAGRAPGAAGRERRSSTESDAGTVPSALPAADPAPPAAADLLCLLSGLRPSLRSALRSGVPVRPDGADGRDADVPSLVDRGALGRPDGGRPPA